jgi:hypothetical protein
LDDESTEVNHCGTETSDEFAALSAPRRAGYDGCHATAGRTLGVQPLNHTWRRAGMAKKSKKDKKKNKKKK